MTIIVVLEGRSTALDVKHHFYTLFTVTMIVRSCRGWKIVGDVFPLAERKASLSPWFRVCILTMSTCSSSSTTRSQFSRFTAEQHLGALQLLASTVFSTHTRLARACITYLSPYVGPLPYMIQAACTASSILLCCTYIPRSTPCGNNPLRHTISG